MENNDFNDIQETELNETDLTENSETESGESQNEKQAETASHAVKTENDDPEIKAFIKDATETREDVRQERRDEKTAQSLKISESEAASMAAMAIQQCFSLVEQQTGAPVELNPVLLQVSITLMVPCIMKHGETVKRMMRNMSDVDRDSYMPEFMAAAGVAIPALVCLKQVKKARMSHG